ncbi:MAG: hypothetical protein V1859_02875 [archaeon]
MNFLYIIWQWQSIKHGKNYFTLLILFIVILNTGCSKTGLSDLKIKVTDSLLTKDKMLCSPQGELDGVPNCLSMAARKETNILEYEYLDKKYDFVRAGTSARKCQLPSNENPQEIIIYENLNRNSAISLLRSLQKTCKLLIDNFAAHFSRRESFCSSCKT